MIDNNLLSEEHAPPVYTFYTGLVVLLYYDAKHSYVRLTDDGAVLVASLLKNSINTV